MQFAESNSVSIRTLLENEWGSIPSTGVTRARRFTSSSIGASKETSESEEIRDDGQVEDISEVGKATGGDINFEFAAGTVDEELSAVTRGAWSRPMTFDTFYGSIVSFTATDEVTISGGDLTPYFTAGRRVLTSGFKTPTNNNYFQISAVAFDSPTNTTTITFTDTTGTVEAGNDNGRISDANDVLFLNNTNLRLGTAGERAIDSNSTNAFASSIAAGQLFIGQRLFVEGAGFEEGSVEFAAPAEAGDKVVISDGKRSVTFEFGTAVTFGAVAVAPGSALADSAANLAAAINEQRVYGKLSVSAKASTGTVTIRNLRVTGGSISSADATVSAFSGGDETARGFFTITGLTSDKVTVAEDIATVTGAPITIKSSMLRNPGNAADMVYRSFTVEEAYATVNQYFVRDGLRVGTFSMETSAQSKITGSFGYTGRASDIRQSPLLGAAPYTPADAAQTRITNASTNVGAIRKDGSELATAVQSISFSAEVNLRAQTAVGSEYARGIGSGRLNVSGGITAYFQDGILFQHFLDHDTVSFDWPYTDVDGNTYHFTIPAAVITSDTVAPGGIDQDVTENMEWQAKRDPTTNCTLQIDRFSSIHPIAAF